MALPETPQGHEVQSGKRVGLSILFFVVGFMALLILLKYLIG